MLKSRKRNHQFDNCQKNPGHKNMVPLKDLKLEDIPEEWRFPDLYDVILKQSRRVVKITVPYVSPSRPEKYPLGRFRGKRVHSVGTGVFVEEPGLGLDKEAPPIECRLTRCDIPKPHQTTPTFRVITANHVIFDDVEAEQATVEFFYDSAEDDEMETHHVVKCHGVKVLTSERSADSCCILCVSHDLDLFKKVRDPSRASLLSTELKPTPAFVGDRQRRDPLVVITSHPHGHYKHVSFGTCVGYTLNRHHSKDMKDEEDLTLLEQLFAKRMNFDSMKSEKKGQLPEGVLERKMAGFLLSKLKELHTNSTHSERTTETRNKKECLPEECARETKASSKGYIDRICDRAQKCGDAMESLKGLGCTTDGTANSPVGSDVIMKRHSLDYVTYTAATCPGSSGAPVLIFLPENDSRAGRFVTSLSKHPRSNPYSTIKYQCSFSSDSV